MGRSRFACYLSAATHCRSGLGRRDGLNSFTFTLLVAVLAVFSANASAQSEWQAEYNKLLKAHEKIDTVGPSPFGEEVNLYTGELTFKQTDIRLAGIGPDIEVTRTTRSSQSQADNLGDAAPSAAFGSWDIGLPRIETYLKLPSHLGWGEPGELWKVWENQTQTYNRCSSGNPIPDLASEQWWRGIEFIDGQAGRHTLFRRIGSSVAAPSDGHSYPLLTNQNWQ